MDINQLTQKLNDFHTALQDITDAIRNKDVALDGGGLLSLNNVAEKIDSIQTQRDMGVQEVTIEQRTPIRLGIKIDESEQDPTHRVSYIGEAQGMVPLYNDLETGECNYGIWKNSWIFGKIYPVMLKTNGTIDYRLNPDDQTQKITGENSDISSTSYDGNAMICVERFYTKFSMDGEDEVIEISPIQEDGFEPIGFVREDDSVADRIFLPMFGGSLDSNGKLRSLVDQTITSSFSWTYNVAAAEKNGSGYGICSFAMNEAFSVVLTILIKSCDWKKKLGEGRIYAGDNHTGILANKGAFGYDQKTRTIKVLWMEDFLNATDNSGRHWWESGILSFGNQIYVKMKPPYSGTSVNGYELVPDYIVGKNTYISKMKADNKYGRIPVAYEGSQTTYENAYWYTQSSGEVCVSQRGESCGVWGRSIWSNASFTRNTISASLSYLPPN